MKGDTERGALGEYFSLLNSPVNYFMQTIVIHPGIKNVQHKK